MQAVVLRYGHRYERDYRVTTHCGLVARAFGAEKIIICGDEDNSIIESVGRVVEQWGGLFEVVMNSNYRKIICNYREQGYAVVHLTMYGLPVQKKIAEIKGNQKVLVIVGSHKVPREIYDLADFNVGVTSQPHSEIAALGVFLHELFDGKELDKKFSNAKKIVIPDEIKKIVENK